MSPKEKKALQDMKPWIEHVVEEKLAEIVGDPDENLKLKDEIRDRLKQSLKSKKPDAVSGEEAAKRLGLRW